MTHDPKSRTALAPVGWLLGPDLLAKLSKMLRKRSDPRDWMPYYRGALHDECWTRDGSLVNVSGKPGGLEFSVEGAAEAPRSPQGAERVVALDSHAAGEGDGGSVWFDYASDTGDSSESTYSVAYASMIAFDGYDAKTTWSEGQEPVLLTPVVATDGSAALPRGQFIFVGGDTAYHVADAVTLRNRVEQPFHWAFADAKANGQVPPHASAEDRTRRIYGIPGNHDWYDNLQGFSLVFRLGPPSSKRASAGLDPIELPELERVQLASYVAIQLPHGWQFWGLDIDTPLDPRQQAYFESLGATPPERLILATPSPALAFGAAVPHPSHTQATEALGIPVPRVPLTPGDAVTPKYRLDLSGDVHHYARYYPRPEHEHYGSVVSGLGGAFHHPTFSRATGSDQRVEPVRLFPSRFESKRSVGARLLTAKSTWYGSWARVFPFVITFVLSFAATHSGGGSWLLDQLLSLLPGYALRPVADGGGQELLRSMAGLTTFLVAVLGVVVGVLFAQGVYDAQVAAPHRARGLRDVLFRPGWASHLLDLRRSYWFAWTIAIVLGAPFVLYPLWGWSARTPALDVATVVIVIALPLAGAYAAVTAGAQHLAFGGKVLVGLVGFVHAAAQVITATLFARMVPLSRATFAAALAAFGVAALGLHAGRPLFRGETKLHALGLAALWAIVLACSFGLVVFAADGKVVEHGPWVAATLHAALSGALAMPLGTTWLIWYLAVAGVLDAHNNEVGGAARVTEFREFIRFHVHAGGVTGYVIAVESGEGKTAMHHQGKNLVFKLIDVFTVVTPVPAENAEATASAGATEAGAMA